ncbi:hypothetical protein B0T26DRAFT_872089 [Lasiosphaeria miniovina]|uniref:Uncharacterized protein n=1 Tax=Lasiosphaeria miniovina TaxID=1954250 RepID=A0AA40AL20_9PEZI|nr:uncharacterized protein B0T26DRAFT_872089 [Lasiosphaeria miniovina]KAK0717672.1 hypothetical protein B0T26DRAFT_872089 [Lasiosphaeria miniovina]
MNTTLTRENPYQRPKQDCDSCGVAIDVVLLTEYRDGRQLCGPCFQRRLDETPGGTDGGFYPSHFEEAMYGVDAPGLGSNESSNNNAGQGQQQNLNTVLHRQQPVLTSINNRAEEDSRRGGATQQRQRAATTAQLATSTMAPIYQSELLVAGGPAPFQWEASAAHHRPLLGPHNHDNYNQNITTGRPPQPTAPVPAPPWPLPLTYGGYRPQLAPARPIPSPFPPQNNPPVPAAPAAAEPPPPPPPPVRKCKKCSNPARPGGILHCQACTDRYRRRKNQKKAQGRCVNCGKPNDNRRFVHCTACRNRSKEKSAAKRSLERARRERAEVLRKGKGKGKQGQGQQVGGAGGGGGSVVEVVEAEAEEALVSSGGMDVDDCSLGGSN